MNIWVTDRSPFAAAGSLDGLTIVKTIPDVAQMLSTVAIAEGKVSKLLAQPLDLNEPCVRWLRNSKHNVHWLVAHAYGLLAEYEERFRREHSGLYMFEEIMDIYKYDTPKPEGFLNLTKHVGHGFDFTYISDVPTAYQMYFTAIWNIAGLTKHLNPRKRVPTWTGLNPPSWYMKLETQR